MEDIEYRKLAEMEDHMWWFRALHANFLMLLGRFLEEPQGLLFASLGDVEEELLVLPPVWGGLGEDPPPGDAPGGDGLWGFDGAELPDLPVLLGARRSLVSLPPRATPTNITRPYRRNANTTPPYPPNDRTKPPLKQSSSKQKTPKHNSENHHRGAGE